MYTRMKILKYISSIVFLLLAAGQIMPIYLLSSGLLQGEAENDMAYSVGKLTGHIMVTILVSSLALKLFKRAKKQGATNAASV